MSTAGWRRCCYCETWFRAQPRNAYHQRFCSRPDCQVASKRTSQRKWCHRNPGYFHGDQYVRKVRSWRRSHPGYWRTKGTAKVSGPPDALQDLLTSQGFGNEDVKTFRTCLSEEIARPLQDVLMAQQHALVGLAALISGVPLQENIEKVLTSCYERGQRIGGKVPWMPSNRGEYEKNTQAGSPGGQCHPEFDTG